ncbi:Cell division control protein 48 like C [Apostasia shenzhenica]|uniref:Cell division control protein 48 like C n=1 Tax=Apostasia shenzhenica TaxID=1088818 RepID=A0A2I0A1B9_9ASPA|nr:Cell division control protein 48 like C [Apostasia shenzhenica]
MGKRLRRSGGGGRSLSAASVMDRSILLRRIKSLSLDGSLDSTYVVQRLREHYPDYARIKLQPFSLRLQEAMVHLRNSSRSPSATAAAAAGVKSSSSVSSEDDSGGEMQSRSKRGREDGSEKRLLRAESEHLCRWRSLQAAPSSSSPDLSDDSTSTSDYAAFDEKIDTRFDVTKLMLREKYGNQSKQRMKKEEDEKNLEIEVAVSEKRKIEMPVGKGSRSGKESNAPGLKVRSLGDKSNNVAGVKGKGGPMFRDLGGMNRVLEELMVEVIIPLCHPELPRRLGVKPVAGILLHGPPGCGKTKLAHAIANETGVPFYKISATEVVSGISGVSEENIRDLFNKAYRTAPSIVFIDEIDAIASKRENLQREMERRIVTQLMTCMDEAHQTLRAVDADADRETSDKISNYVLVIGATNRPDAIDQALRRPGRFDKEITLGVPNEIARLEILSVLTCDLKLEGNFDLFKIARSTPGFVGADLVALVNKAGNLAMKRIVDRKRPQLIDGVDGQMIKDWWRHPWSPEEIESLSITMSDFEEATGLVQPSTKREGFSSIPNVNWEDVGGLDSLREAFDRYIIQCIKHPEDYEELGVDMEFGFLLYGPPGCGKTLIAKAVAHEAGANFIHIKGPEILRKYVGESEQEVRTIFSRARTCSPCIIFFDEVDALTPKRGREGAWVVERALNQLLIELDGADQRHGVYVIGATNTPDAIDPAVLRPGRFGKLFYVPLPSAEERRSILKALARKKPVASDVDFDALAQREACRNLSGADLAALMNEAAMNVKEEKRLHLDQGTPYTEPLIIKTTHIEKAFDKISPSVSEERRLYYEALSQKLRRS